MTSFKFNVFPDIKSARGVIICTKVRYETIHEGRPPPSVHGTGANIDFRISKDVGRSLVLACPPMVIGMKIKYDEPTELLLHLCEDPVRFFVKSVVACQGTSY